MWQYENFGIEDLKGLLEAKSGKHLIKKMQFMTGIGVVFEVVFIVIVGASFGTKEPLHPASV